MSEPQTRHDNQQAPPGLNKLAGRRVELIRLLEARQYGKAARQCLLFMLDDGYWFAFFSTGHFLPLSHRRALDIHTLLRQGANAYRLVEMAVANPDASAGCEK